MQINITEFLLRSDARCHTHVDGPIWTVADINERSNDRTIEQASKQVNRCLWHWHRKHGLTFKRGRVEGFVCPCMYVCARVETRIVNGKARSLFDCFIIDRPLFIYLTPNKIDEVLSALCRSWSDVLVYAFDDDGNTAEEDMTEMKRRRRRRRLESLLIDWREGRGGLLDSEVEPDRTYTQN